MRRASKENKKVDRISVSVFIFALIFFFSLSLLLVLVFYDIVENLNRYSLNPLHLSLLPNFTTATARTFGIAQEVKLPELYSASFCKDDFLCVLQIKVFLELSA